MMSQFIPTGFSFLKSLNSGFLGPSYLLKKNDNNKQYICKGFIKSAIGDDADVDNFIQIIKISRKLKEACFLPYHYFYIMDQYIYAVRPFFEGLDLSAYIANCATDINIVYAQWKVLCRLYRHLHKRKISPNFIKPSNIFMENGSIAFITDIYPPPRTFNPTIHRSNPFDVGFLSPEYLIPGSFPTYKADIWSLGILLWFMTVKKLPWNINNVVVMLKQIQKGSPENFAVLPVEIRDIVASMLVFNPEKRVDSEVLVHSRPGASMNSHDDRHSTLKGAADNVLKSVKISASPSAIGGILPVRRRNPNEDGAHDDQHYGDDISPHVPQRFTRMVNLSSQRQNSLHQLSKISVK
ncbi:AGC family protein kinase [Trichomonas vaginalis G3]|uniref:AGC family protein kinase n=1 Tax=Trichomonas vaginalis (strain ATCC PRA-98 / G3) TaxID=412133 RepID=A2EN03_TRIV3|nr:cellular response to bisphenol A [Trichomonas vaginalis G3]EAY05988.1 AGC family protein kinase [Trichomonas vaginalis G3]KAI5512027.1 cellular response to bisphenol A [Trichomonas vaginalis G3]|eukprot:XP_001318211.1 AGC family protein kinase [Trichomonas vaginalis G3]